MHNTELRKIRRLRKARRRPATLLSSGLGRTGCTPHGPGLSKRVTTTATALQRGSCATVHIAGVAHVHHSAAASRHRRSRSAPAQQTLLRLCATLTGGDAGRAGHSAGSEPADKVAAHGPGDGGGRRRLSAAVTGTRLPPVEGERVRNPDTRSLVPCPAAGLGDVMTFRYVMCVCGQAGGVARANDSGRHGLGGT